MRRRLASTALLALACSTPLTAGVGPTGGTITDGDANFIRTTSSFDLAPEASLTGVGSTLVTDHLFEFGWWFRIGADTREFPLGTPDAESYVGDSSHITWSDVGAPPRGLISADEVAVVHDAGATSAGDGGWVEIRLTVTNISGSPLTLDLYAYADFDVSNTPADDSSTLGTAAKFKEILVSDASNRGEFSGYLADAFQVGAFASIRNLLNDTNVNDLTNGASPFGPGDFTAAQQWSNLSLGAGASRVFFVVLAVRSFFGCTAGVGNSIFCDDFTPRANPFWSEITPRSCSGFCFPKGTPDGLCYCDDLCLGIGDCCLDACLTCGRCPAL